MVMITALTDGHDKKGQLGITSYQTVCMVHDVQYQVGMSKDDQGACSAEFLKLRLGKTYF